MAFLVATTNENGADRTAASLISHGNRGAADPADEGIPSPGASALGKIRFGAARLTADRTAEEDSTVN